MGHILAQIQEGQSTVKTKDVSLCGHEAHSEPAALQATHPPPNEVKADWKDHVAFDS